MSKHYGITCHKCGEPIVLANIENEGPIDITFYTVPTEPQRCPFKGSFIQSLSHTCSRPLKTHR